MSTSLSLAPRARRDLVGASLLAWLVLGVATGAAAQDASVTASVEPAEPAEYTALIDGALTEFQAGRWVEARALFERAHASFPNARTLRGIGMAAFEMADYPRAITALEGALESAVRPLTAEQSEQVSSLLVRARALVGTFVVPPAAADVRLSIDGALVSPEGAWPASQGRVSLGVGTHEIVLRDGDGRTSRTRLAVAGGEVDRAIDVVPPGGRAGEAAANGSDPAPWVLSGIGAALAIAGAVLYGVGASDIAAVNAMPSGTEWSSVAGVYDSAPILTGTGLASLITGSAMVVVGVGWGLGAALSSEGDDRRARLRLGPLGFAIEGAL